MENLGQEIDCIKVELTEKQSLRLITKTANGKMMLDVRKWIKYPNLDDFVPSKKGITMDFEQWNQAIPKIRELLDHNNCNSPLNREVK